jgi:hypothetical protein
MLFVKWGFTAVLVITAAFVVSSVAGDDVSWTQRVIKMEDRCYDFKTVAKGTQSEHRFVFRNPFEETLHIASYTSSCTCTTPLLEGDKDTLQTYDETAIIAQFRTDRFENQKSATISVVIDKPYRAEIQLNVRGEIRSDITVTPNSVLLGSIKEGVETSRTLSVVYTGQNSNWRLVDFKCNNEHLKAELVDTEMHVGKKIFRVKVTMNDKTPSGNIAEHLYFISNDPAHRREIPIYVQATVGTQINVVPPTVFLGTLKPGEASPVKTAVVRGTQPFRIKKIVCDNPAVIIKNLKGGEGAAEDKPALPVYPLSVRYTNPVSGEGSPQDGKILAKVRIETDNPDLTPAFNVTMKLELEP